MGSVAGMSNKVRGRGEAACTRSLVSRAGACGGWFHIVELGGVVCVGSRGTAECLFGGVCMYLPNLISRSAITWVLPGYTSS